MFGVVMTETRTASVEQQKEFDAVLQKLDADIEKHNFHPIVKPVMFLLQNEDAAWWPQGMPLENVEQITQLVDETIKDKTVVKAMYDLLRISATVGQMQGGKMAGAHLMRLCDQIIKDKNLMALVQDGEFEAGTLAKAKDATGQASRAQPAKVGEKAPEGAMRIDQLPGRKPRI